MSRPRLDWRPLPERLLVAAFPLAYAQSPSAPPRPEGDFFVVQAGVADVELPEPVMAWLSLSPPQALSADMTRVDYQAEANTLAARHLSMPVVVRKRRYAIEFAQQPGLLVQTQMVRVLNSPLTIDFLIAITFIAEQIRKIPLPPIKLLVAVIAVLVIVVLGIAIAAIRALFADVPQPCPLSADTNGVPIVIVPGVSVTQGLPRPDVSAENQLVALQTIKQVYWLVKQVA